MLTRSLIVLSFAAISLKACGGKKSAAPAERPPQQVGVVTIKPERAEIVTELPGRTAAFRVAEVRPQVNGIVLRRFFEEGGNVDVGQQLYQIDPARYRAASDSAQAAVAKAEASVEIARLLAERRKQMVATNAISKHDYDDAIAAFKEAEADLAAARAKLDEARIDVVYTKVLSPIAGTIGRSTVTEGALVTSGQAQAIATVQQLDPIYVDITQSSAQLLRLQRELASGEFEKRGTREAIVRLVLEDGTEYSESGKLQFSEVSVDQGTGSVTLRAVFPNPNRELLPGMFVRAMVNEGVKDQSILVPQRGVTRNARGEPTALVVDKENKVELRSLETSRTIGDKWLVTKGIAEGDRVIVEGLQKIRPGAVVNPVESDKPEVALNKL
jgi:membrane fusion protein (multidrug efflux system)